MSEHALPSGENHFRCQQRRGLRFPAQWAGYDALLIQTGIIETGLEEIDSGVMLASSELLVHRAIYQNTSALAVVHVHPPHAVALSLMEEAFQCCVSMEEACRVLYFLRTLQQAKIALETQGTQALEYRKHSAEYKS